MEDSTEHVGGVIRIQSSKGPPTSRPRPRSTETRQGTDQTRTSGPSDSLPDTCQRPSWGREGPGTSSQTRHHFQSPGRFLLRTRVLTGTEVPKSWGLDTSTLVEWWKCVRNIQETRNQLKPGVWFRFPRPGGTVSEGGTSVQPLGTLFYEQVTLPRRAETRPGKDLFDVLTPVGTPGDSPPDSTHAVGGRRDVTGSELPGRLVRTRSPGPPRP